MRDPKRIDAYIEQLRAAWKTFPDWRFGQLLSNIVGGVMQKLGANDVFYIEDADFFRAFEETLEEMLEEVDW